MSDKKAALKGFLNKQGKKKTTKKEGESAKNPEEIKAQEQQAKATTESQQKNAKKEDGSDEEDDDLDIAYGNIKEQTEVQAKQNTEDKAKQGFGFDEGSSKKEEKKVEKKKNANEITFGGPRPTFGRKKVGKLGGEFAEGLDDIDDAGQTKSKAKKNTEPAAA